MAAAAQMLTVFFVFVLPILVLADGADVSGVCSLTLHPSVCYRSLAPFSGAKRRSPHWWGRVAVAVTIVETRKVGLYLVRLKRSGRWRGGAMQALYDCAEFLDEAVFLLCDALAELRQLQRRSFAWQTSNVQTWISAALTYGETCLDGFADVAAPLPWGEVRNVTYFTSNALALANYLAASGEWR